MSPKVIRQVATRIREDNLLGDSLTIVWHAGEPLVLPPDYYAEAFAIFSEVLGDTCQLSHSIQTNAALINDQWCALFKQHNTRIGISLDGPEHIHNKHRKTRDGKGAYSLVIRGMKFLQKHDIPFHVIAVITEDSLAHAEELHHFFTSQNIHEIGFNFDEAEGLNSSSSLNGQEAKHRSFYQQMMQYSIAPDCSYQIRELVTAFRLISQGLPDYTWQGKSWPNNSQTLPFAIITVGWNGDFSTFSPELLGQPDSEFNNFILGNVAETSFLQCTETPVFQNIWKLISQGTSLCQQNCAYFKYCGGGAPANKLYENGRLDSTETLYCRSMLQRPFETVLQQLESEANGVGNSSQNKSEIHSHTNIAQENSSGK